MVVMGTVMGPASVSTTSRARSRQTLKGQMGKQHPLLLQAPLQRGHHVPSQQGGSGRSGRQVPSDKGGWERREAPLPPRLTILSLSSPWQRHAFM